MGIIKKTIKPLKKIGHKVEKHAIRPVFHPVNKLVKSLEKRGFVFNAQIGSDGFDLSYGIGVDHKHWGVVLQNGDIGFNVHPQIKIMREIDWEIGLGTDGVHIDFNKYIKEINGRLGLGFDNNGYYIEYQNTQIRARIQNNDIIIIKTENTPTLFIPPYAWIGADPKHTNPLISRTVPSPSNITDAMAIRCLICDHKLWNSAIDDTHNPIIWFQNYYRKMEDWAVCGISDGWRAISECMSYWKQNEIDIAKTVKNYGLKQMLLQDNELWNKTMESGLRPYQLLPPKSPNIMSTQQAGRYLLFNNDLFNSAPHGRQIEWAKEHWKNSKTTRNECFDPLEPALIFKITDYYIKRLLIDNPETWDEAIVGAKKNNISIIDFAKKSLFLQIQQN